MPKRGQHRVPVNQLRLTDPVTAKYQAEVDETMRRAQARYDRAVAAVARAEQRAERARAAARSTTARRELDLAEADLELRREELRRIESLMHGAPQSAQHRGTAGYRPIPAPRTF